MTKSYKPVTWEANGITWTVETKYVNVNTGEIIHRKDAVNRDKYIIIKTSAYETEYNHNRTKATIRYTKECRRQPQQKLPFN